MSVIGVKLVAVVATNLCHVLTRSAFPTEDGDAALEPNYTSLSLSIYIYIYIYTYVCILPEG